MGILAAAQPSGSAWGKAIEVEGLEHVTCGVSGPWMAEDGCSIAVTAASRATSSPRDLAGSTRVLP